VAWLGFYFGNRSHYQYADRMTKRALATLLATITVLAGCSSTPSPSSTDTVSVATTLYPIAEIVQRVGGDIVDVINLTPPGTDAHDIELTAKQAQRLEQSDVVFYLGDNFQPAVEKAITALGDTTRVNLFDSVELLKASNGSFGVHDHGNEDEHSGEEEFDPHVWLDPANMIAMTKTVVSTLSQKAPENADVFASNSTAYIAELTELGTMLDEKIGLRPGTDINRCADVNLYTAHQGFKYLAERAGLNLVPIAGVNPDEQVSAQYLESLSDGLKGKNITIFYESLISSSVTKTLADSLNVQTDVLNPVEGLTQEDIDNGVTYISAQRDNIAKIAKALRCS